MTALLDDDERREQHETAELDVWQYIEHEKIELPSIYFAHCREVVERDGMLYGLHLALPVNEDEKPYEAMVRYRTVGDASCTAAVRSEAYDTRA